MLQSKHGTWFVFPFQFIIIPVWPVHPSGHECILSWPREMTHSGWEKSVWLCAPHSVSPRRPSIHVLCLWVVALHVPEGGNLFYH